MRDFVTNILQSSEYNYKPYKKEDNFDLWGNGFEFFILKNYDESSFENFFKSKQTDELIYEYQNYEDKIKKNTSLLIFVKVRNISEFYNNYINKIMKIEEDEYYFRKSVILYTDSGLQNLKYYCTSERIIEYIFSKNEEESIKFEAFECDMFFEDAYFIAMQLVIKLPFISLPHAEKSYESIESKIESQIEKKDLQENIEKVDRILEIFDSIAKSSDDIENQLMKNDTLLENIKMIIEE